MPAIVANLLLIIVCVAAILIAVAIKLRCRHIYRDTISVAGNSWYWECRDCGKRKTESLTR